MSGLAWSKFQDVAREASGKTAMRHGSDSASFADLERSAEAWASTIAASSGQRVILYSENAISTAAAVLGIWRCDAVPVWINAAAPLGHLELAIAETDAVCVISSKPDLDAAVSCRVISAPSEATAQTAPNTQPGEQSGENIIGSIVYTSGSTGQPKGVVQRPETLIDASARVAKTLGYRPDDSILCPVPFAFDYGWGQLLSMIFGGYTLILPEPNNAFGLCAAIAEHKPSVFAGVPAAFGNLLSGLSPIRETDCSSVRLITNTGSRIPDNILTSLWETFPKAELSLNYGLTETYRTASLPVALAKVKPNAVGTAIVGAQIAVITPEGTPCAPHETGEIIHRGAGVFEEYWKKPEKTADVRRPDPIDASSGQMAVYTGDLGYLDEDGALFIVGRKDRQMKSMGVRVSPDEIEKILLATGHMAEVAITSRSDDMVGDMVVAFVVAQADADVDAQASLKALKRDARAGLSPYMQPRLYHLLDALPRNPNGKVDYALLKRQAAGEAV